MVCVLKALLNNSSEKIMRRSIFNIYRKDICSFRLGSDKSFCVFHKILDR